MEKPDQTHQNKRLFSVRGILIPEDWDDSNQITKLVLCKPDEQEYLVEMDDIGKQLILHKGSKVTIKGSLRDTGSRRKTLTVLSYEVHPW